MTKKVCMMPRKLFVALFSAVTLLSPISGMTTGICVVVNRNCIVLGVDSRNTGIQGSTGIANKIVSVNGYLFAMSGWVYSAGYVYESGRYSKVSGDFIAPEIVANALKSNSYLYMAVDLAGRRLCDSMRVKLTEMKQTNPNSYRQLYQMTKPGVKAFIVGKVEGVPTVYILEVRLKFGAPDQFEYHVTSMACNSPIVLKIGAGHAGDLSPKTMAQVPFNIEQGKTHPEQVVEEYLQQDAKNRPNEVGPPFDIVRITYSSIDWIKRKPTVPVQF